MFTDDDAPGLSSSRDWISLRSDWSGANGRSQHSRYWIVHWQGRWRAIVSHMHHFRWATMRTVDCHGSVRRFTNHHVVSIWFICIRFRKALNSEIQAAHGHELQFDNKKQMNERVNKQPESTATTLIKQHTSSIST